MNVGHIDAGSSYIIFMTLAGLVYLGNIPLCNCETEGPPLRSSIDVIKMVCDNSSYVTTNESKVVLKSGWLRYRVEVLNCSDGYLTWISPEGFKSSERDANNVRQVSECSTMDLSRNRIKGVQVDSLISLPYLEILLLSDNELTFLPRQLFVPSSRMTLLDLSRNPLTKQIAVNFGAMVNLEALHLRGVDMGDWSWEITLGNYLATGTSRGVQRTLYLQDSRFACTCKVMRLMNGMKIKTHVVTQPGGNSARRKNSLRLTTPTTTTTTTTTTVSGDRQGATANDPNFHELSDDVASEVKNHVHMKHRRKKHLNVCSKGLKGLPYNCLFQSDDKYCWEILSNVKNLCTIKDGIVHDDTKVVTTSKDYNIFKVILFTAYAMVPIVVAVYVFRQVSGVLGILDASLERSETSRLNNRRMQEDLKQALSVQMMANEESECNMAPPGGTMYVASDYSEKHGDEAKPANKN